MPCIQDQTWGHLAANQHWFSTQHPGVMAALQDMKQWWTVSLTGITDTHYWYFCHIVMKLSHSWNQMTLKWFQSLKLFLCFSSKIIFLTLVTLVTLYFIIFHQYFICCFYGHVSRCPITDRPMETKICVWCGLSLFILISLPEYTFQIKMAEVIALYIKGEWYEAKNYNPFSLLFVYNKPFEKLLCRPVMKTTQYQ